MKNEGLALRNQCETTLGILLETLIHERVTTRKNEEEDLWQSLSLITSSIACIDDGSRKVLATLLNIDSRIAVLNLSAMTSVCLDKHVDEVANNLFVCGTLNNNEAP